MDGAIRCKKGAGGNLFTKESYDNYVVRLRFKLPPGGNNGLAIHYSGKGDAAYDAVEIQVRFGAAQFFCQNSLNLWWPILGGRGGPP